MNLRIDVPPNLEQALKLRAAAAGKDVETFVVDALRDELGEASDNTQEGKTLSSNAFGE